MNFETTDTSQVNWTEVANQCIRHRLAPLEPQGMECMLNIIQGRCAYVQLVKNEAGPDYYQERDPNDRPAEEINRAVIVEINPEYL